MRLIKNKFKLLVRQIAVTIVIGLSSGLIYMSLELIYRGFTHWSSFLMGFIAGAFICDPLNNNSFKWDDPLIIQMTISSICITLMEYCVGKLVNTDYSVWDYRDCLWNVEGMVCLGASLLWGILSLIPIFLGDFIRWKFFGEDKPKYKWI